MWSLQSDTAWLFPFRRGGCIHTFSPMLGRLLVSPSQNFARSCSSITRVWEIGRDCRAVFKLFTVLLFLHDSPKFPFSKMTATKLDSLQPLKPKWQFPNISCPTKNLSYNYTLCPLHGWAAFSLLLGGISFEITESHCFHLTSRFTKLQE